MLFNDKLFYKNGCPLKFYLDGYTNVQIREMATIVEAFGGVFYKPGENTIVFSYPDAPSTGNYHRFDSKFLFDSVTKGQRQELDKIPFTGIKNTTVNVVQEITCAEQSMASDSNTNNCDNGDNICNSRNRSYEVSSSAGPDNSATRGTQLLSKSKKLVTIKAKKSNRDKRKTGSFIPYSADESIQIFYYLIDNEAVADVWNLKTWSKMEAAKIFVEPYRSKESLRNHYFDKLRGRIQKYVADESIIQKFEDLTPYQRKSKYSREENQKIIDYGIKKNMIAHVGGSKVWKKIEAEWILTDPRRSWQAVRTHWRSTLQHRIEEYTNDPKAIEAFAEGKKLRYLEYLERMAKN